MNVFLELHFYFDTTFFIWYHIKKIEKNIRKSILLIKALKI